jgi:hypothetical protein
MSSPTPHPRGYEAVKALASELGVYLRDVLALSEDNDPFYAGRAAGVLDAQWFLELWRRFNFGRGTHLRRVHYKLVVIGNVTMRGGETPYVNNEQCWDRLQLASKAARYLGLVAADDFIDQRTPDPILHAAYREFEPEPHCEIQEPEWTLPRISFNLETSLAMPAPHVGGYDYELSDQWYHIVLLIEKSTMNDILLPICRRFGVDLLTGAGYASVTTAVNLLKRIRGKPVRGFFISDFDPAGRSMPTGLARQVEFWRREFAPDSEVKITHLALTEEQANHYQLPRVPIKDSDKRKRGFEDTHGEGCCELDALEALFPGELARLVKEAIAPYFDSELEGGLMKAGWKAEADAQAAWDDETSETETELDAIAAEAAKVVKRFEPRVKTLADAFDKAMQPLRDRLDLARQALTDKAEMFEAELPDRPALVEANTDESQWLFDSGREYMEQIKFYHRHRDGK